MAVTVSPKFQVVIPKAVRDAAGLKPGAKFEVLSYGKRIELVPVVSPRELRGRFPGLQRHFRRDRRDRV